MKLKTVTALVLGACVAAASAGIRAGQEAAEKRSDAEQEDRPKSQPERLGARFEELTGINSF